MDAPKKPARWKWVFWLLIVPVLLFILYVWFVLTWSYSRGERAGYLQKLSERGWICKTWEGEMAIVTMPGTVAEKFMFSVRSEALARRLNAVIGQRVTLDYEQHIGIPTACFGDTEYFINDVRVVPEFGTPRAEPVAPTPAPAAAVPPAAAPAAPDATTPAAGTSAPAK
ncbi:MAG: hypothetical protein U1F52_00290 [Burkholderiales bacterium]